jgi:ribonuclease HI
MVEHRKPMRLFDEDEEYDRKVKTKGQLTVFSDGASRGNPGPAGAGAVIIDSSGRIIREISMFLGQMTNNQAEYQALILALKEVSSLRPEKLIIKMDSQLVARHITGEYKVKDLKLIPLHAIVMQQLKLIKSWKVEHVPREQNCMADALANQAIDRS